MPTYDYQCPHCKRVEEVMHPIAELEKPSKETLQEITCRCTGKPKRMIIAYLEAPGIKTPTRNRYLNEDRKKRNHNHFKREVLPTIEDPGMKKHHTKKLGYKN